MYVRKSCNLHTWKKQEHWNPVPVFLAVPRQLNGNEDSGDSEDNEDNSENYNDYDNEDNEPH